MQAIYPWTAALAALMLGACGHAPLERGGPATLAAASPASSLSPVSVEYVEPQKFTDLGNSYHSLDRERAGDLDELRRHIDRSAQRLLPPGQRLSIRVTDVDRAGGFEPWRTRAMDVRIVRDIYPPRIDLQFQLTCPDGSVLKQGERKLRDPAFMMNSFSDSDAMRYEKALLSTWLEEDFGVKRGRLAASLSKATPGLDPQAAPAMKCP